MRGHRIRPLRPTFETSLMSASLGPGESAALAAAFCWASASLLYGRTRLTALGLNFGKNLLASLILLLQLSVAALWSGRTLLSASADTWWWLGLSGLAGIVAGDTFYFRSLQILGARRALILSTTAPIFAAFMGWAFLGEALSSQIALGMTLTISGIVIVVAERSTSVEAPGLFPGATATGILAALAGAGCTALGGVFSRVGMQNVDSVEGAFIRLVVSAAAVTAIVGLRGELRSTRTQLADRKLLKTFAPAILMGTWLGIWLSQIAFKHAPVSVVTTLLSTTPIFAVPLVRLFDRHRISRRAILGTLIAVSGVVLVVRG